MDAVVLTLVHRSTPGPCCVVSVACVMQKDAAGQDEEDPFVVFLSLPAHSLGTGEKQGKPAGLIPAGITGTH